MTRDWDSEQKPLQDEQEAALSERVRLKPSGSATPDELHQYSAAVERHETAKRCLSAFLVDRIRDDPAWRDYGANSRTVSWFNSSAAQVKLFKNTPLGRKESE